MPFLAEPNDLVDIKQRDNEPLKDYIQRFMREATRVKSLSGDGKLIAINSGIKVKILLWSNLKRKSARTTQEFLDWAEEFINLEEAKRKAVVSYRRPPSIRKDVNKWDMTKFCRFHNDYGHETNECNHLKEKIEFLIRQNNAHLKSYVWSAVDQHPQQPPQQQSQQYQSNHPLLLPPVASQLDMICGELHLAKNSGKARERYACSLRHEQEEDALAVQERTPKQPRYECEPITLSDEDTSHIHHPHNDFFVVEVQIANMIVAQTMIDHGSSANILFKSTLERMNLSIRDLEPCE
ncbi:uncharacterized protein LOC133785490 [Humulus lupulus]|uniref:uncharacterized protein LOC133785490 n=1 Tax=Humulus lupulus TaxID=3486 RepID=UPI002B413B54|nr:uncharacterized protein LOC133785490 [Humulus lupulus]